MRSRVLGPAAAVSLVLGLQACGSDGAMFTLPGDAVFPEGIACDHASGDLYVGSTQDGTVYRRNVDDPGELEVFLPGAQDGRESLTGMKVDGAGRLVAAGRSTGRLFVHDTRSGDLLDSFETAEDGEEALLNDLTFADGAAYVTDSFRPVLYRLPLGEEAADVGELQPWLDLEATPVPVEDGFNLNGITSTDDGRFLLTVHSDTGQLFRVSTDDKTVTEVDLGGEDLRSGDGLLLDGTTLFAVVTRPEEQVVRLEVAEDAASARVVERIEDDSFRYPTTLAQCGEDRIQVVNSQLDREDEGEGDGPFTVSDVEVDIP